MSEEMTKEQERSVDQLVKSDPGLSTADLASAGESRDTEEQQRPIEQQTADQPASNQAPQRSDQGEREAERTPVMADDAAEDYRARWQETQADFVDDPRSAVATADALVAEVMKRVAEEFANERNGLERQWNEGGEASTEDLRLAFQRYRSFFSRLLSL